MPYAIKQMIVCESSKKVVALDWIYQNADGYISNQFKLPEPYGEVPLELCTEELMLKWLTGGNGLQNTSEEFDAAIAQRKQQVEFESSLAAYEAQPKSAPTKIVPVEPEPILEPQPEPEEVAEATPETK